MSHALNLVYVSIRYTIRKDQEKRTVQKVPFTAFTLQLFVTYDGSQVMVLPKVLSEETAQLLK